MANNRLLGSAADTSLAISLDQLGAPGVQGELIIQAMFADRDNDNPVRLNDRTTREFEIKARLAKDVASSYDLNGAIDPGSGGSFFTAPEGVTHFQVESPSGVLTIHVNAQRELATAEAEVTTFDAKSARFVFLEMLNGFLDRLSYLAGVPTHVPLTVVRDKRHEVQYMSFVAPPRSAVVGTGGETLGTEMRAVYALYREAMNTTSPYYRVLCFHKILEGLLGTLRVSMVKRAKALKLNLQLEKDFVPDHPDFPQGLRQHIGKPLKLFFDTFLSKQFRDAMAHFNLKNKAAVDVSSPVDASRYLDVAFVADLCARALIANHETALAKVLAAERS